MSPEPPWDTFQAAVATAVVFALPHHRLAAGNERKTPPAEKKKKRKKNKTKQNINKLALLHGSKRAKRDTAHSGRMKVVPKCKQCGGTEFARDIHSASSDLACQQCGSVYEENPIVSEVTFGEASNGAAVVQGSFVGADQSHATYTGGPRGNSMDSRTKTLSSAKRKIRAVAGSLKIPEYVSDAAYQWFSLALANNFVKGRRSQNVIAACLYVACRKEKTHHMLIDFSARLQISVFSVGATFLKMVKVLHITSLPLADPSLFIQHFAEKLEFGDDKVKIVKDAVRLAHRMAEDWIHEGRRPAGVAGACLLLASRMNNHRRSHSEIVAVAHVGEDTLQRRLNEFKNTNSGKLTVKEFREDIKVESSKPPSFQKNLKKREMLSKKQILMLNEQQQMDDPDAKNPDKALIDMVIGNVDLNDQDILDQLERVRARQAKDLEREKASNNIISLNSDLQPNNTSQKAASQKQGGAEEDKSKQDEDPDRPRNLLKLPTSEQILSKISSDPENFEDIDDVEVENFLLSKEESELKERVWIGLNEEFLLSQEQRRLKAEADEISGHQQPKRRKTGSKHKSEQDQINDLTSSGLENALNSIGEASSASAAAKSMLSKKAQSKKINYLALNNLFEES